MRTKARTVVVLRYDKNMHFGRWIAVVECYEFVILSWWRTSERSVDRVEGVCARYIFRKRG